MCMQHKQFSKSTDSQSKKVKHMKEENSLRISKQQDDYSHPGAFTVQPTPTGVGGNLVNNAVLL